MKNDNILWRTRYQKYDDNKKDYIARCKLSESKEMEINTMLNTSKKAIAKMMT